MLRILKVLAIFLLLAAPAAPAAWAQTQVVIPLPPNVAPGWAPIPDVRGVYYSPNMQVDLFRYSGRYYCYYNGLWYRGRAYTGPWRQITNLPPVFYQVGPTYFRATPPGWAKGKKTGWRGAPLPPGQMKKYEGESLPPGQMKKYEEGNLPPGQMKKMYR
jgi:hypothetical protein